MGIVRRGRKPKLQVQETSEEVLNFDPEDESSDRKVNDVTESLVEETDLEEDGDGTGGKAVVVRARPRKNSVYRESRVRPDSGIGPEAAPVGIPAENRFADAPGRPSPQEPQAHQGRYTPPAEENPQTVPANDNSWQNPGTYSRPRSPRTSSFRMEPSSRGFGEGSGPAAYVPSGAPISLPKNLPPMPDIYGKPEPRIDQDNGKPRLCINELIRLNMMDLRDLAACYNISHEDMVNMKKQEIIFSLLKAHTEQGGVIYAYGSLEILPDSYGFLRSPQNSYLPGPDDIYISPSQIRLFALKTGDTVYGQIRSPKEQERFFAMLRVETVNYDDPTVAQNRIPFDNLTPLYPNRKL
ncbi:MAG: Rho termination factor N-terminal domain-containing protein, partial [Treponema sp.]|nr:Rho termination factor N-terminal domain-containing protein [Treponema sp.]